MTDLVERLRPYLRHKHGCAVYWPTDSGCTCGFDELIAALDAQPVGLDVERLAQVLERITQTEPGTLARVDQENTAGNLKFLARAIAAEYTALANEPQP